MVCFDRLEVWVLVPGCAEQCLHLIYSEQNRDTTNSQIQHITAVSPDLPRIASKRHEHLLEELSRFVGLNKRRLHLCNERTTDGLANVGVGEQNRFEQLDRGLILHEDLLSPVVHIVGDVGHEVDSCNCMSNELGLDTEHTPRYVYDDPAAVDSMPNGLQQRVAFAAAFLASCKQC